MPRLIGYGEDALTLWAVSERFDIILDKLEDNSDPSKCTIFYRPSFGRDQYGEFDAIIITSKKVYLVESKWDRSGDVSKGLEEHQIRRHKIFEWYQDNWNGEVGDDWDKFAMKYNPTFRDEFTYLVEKDGKMVKMSKYIPSSSDLLGKNLQTVLEFCKGKKLENVLLYIHKGEPINITIDYKIVNIMYEPIIDNYIELHCARES